MSSTQKRKKDASSQEMTGREKKKVRIAEARTIPTQSPGAGPSQQGPRAVVPMNSLAGLPSAIELEKVVESRAFEISAMQTAMKSASASSTQRVWQALPRHLRRRAASHDVRRVPKRLRERAVAENDALPVKKKNLPKRGKAKQETRTDSLLRRQKDKSWLETHIWHSKRMRMENMWGYRLAVKPTEKAYRPSHRASVQGSIVHDASYYSLVELRGTLETITGSLRMCCDPQGPNPGAASRLTSGSRTHETHIYEPGKYPFGLICPISIIWKPVSECVKGKETGSSTPTSAPGSGLERTVWIRFHPTVHSQVISALQTAGSQYLAKKKAEGNEGVQLEICDLKDQINVFEIMGPQASQVIRGALSAVPGDSRPEFRQFWSSLADVQTSGSVPRNMVIGFTVLDPRLRFPPKLAKPKPTNQRRNDVFPSIALAKSDIWDESVRLGIAKPKYTKKELDDRRAKNLIPGTPLNPQRQDDRVPVILIQRSLEAPRKNGGHPIHGWTLIIPSGWGMAFWNSLVFTGTRVAGQRERQTQAYEAGTAYFPRDYPSTSAYQEFSTAKEDELRDTWERKPPAKRVNYEKLQVDDPFSPNWNRVLGRNHHQGDGGDLVPTQREPTRIAAPWLLRGPDSARIIQQLALPITPPDLLLREMNSLRIARSLGPLPDALNNQDLMQAALVTVKVNVCRRGLPEDLALIYSMEDEEVSKAIAACQVKTDEADPEQFASVLPSESIIGRVTTGNFSLSIGSGYAVGAVSLVKWLALLKQQARVPNTTDRGMSPYVKIRNTNSDQCRLARLELLEEGDG